ncbi:MAG: UDP-N-acetylmuramoyl-L-alanyl-D-glutamate--2,6-diaminopimelate ligase [Elusimicrobia bacterium GWF2_52_66]|nr:MAG: UDP-N-acetylmuramoyl-L-alanyl-D-glutamate--2,6-diaminopimelate ligase [Elusimicrobia bacterium GWA2_51_34]OGR87171.1 MAG: UDP-N-acetylmuramoyl-L-alanyl-D-glutamate--2,6-diaminopimelate ligase [Elusimicrobia bacterium GWF2_52_66]
MAKKDGGVEITAITNDSRKAVKGALFFALPGAKTDGSLYIRQALENGASAVVSQNAADPALKTAYPSAVWLRTPDISALLSTAAANFYHNPSAELKVTGLTGTKGKTTTAYLLESILAAHGDKPGVAGTINYRVNGRVLSKAANTTPLAHDLQALLRAMVGAGAKSAIMEISSHALALKRADNVRFDCAVFTNLQSDHMDFHKTRGDYFLAKARLFELLAASPKKNKTAVINADDEMAAELISGLSRGLKTLTFAVDGKADFKASAVQILEQKTLFNLNAPGGKTPVVLNLLGLHNVYNALAAITAACAMGVGLETAVKGVQALTRVPGRLERIDLGQNFTVFVDYAHTGAALESVLTNLKKLPHAKIITVFGCGGDRDRTKRAPMGAVSCSLSDRVIITSDNPRTEDPARIFSDIEKGLAGVFLNYETLPCRREAIFKAIAAASKGDIVLIAGKGHEDYQILKNETIHFSDREEAEEAIKKKMQNAK